MAQDPEGNETGRPEGELDASPDFDMVTLFSSSGIDAEVLRQINPVAIIHAVGQGKEGIRGDAGHHRFDVGGAEGRHAPV